MSHTMSLFAVSMFIYVWIDNIGSRNNLSWILLGLVAGLMTLIRPQNFLFVVLIGLEWIGFYNSTSNSPTPFRNRIVALFLFTTSFIIMMIPQFIVWKILYGQFIIYSYEGEGFNFTHPKLLKSLFSARHGLISWTPILFLSLIGLFLFIRRQARIGSALLLMFIFQWYLNSSWHYWWYGHSFGGRAYINCSIIFAIGLAVLVSIKKRPAIIIHLFSIFLIIWNLLFTAQYILGMLPYEHAVDWQKVLTNQFEVISTAWDFLNTSF